MGVVTALPGMSIVDGLRVTAPVWGIDPSTLRMAAAVLKPTRHPDEARLMGVRPTLLATSLLTLQNHRVLAMRQVMAVDSMTHWLRELEAEHGRPAKIGLEVPLGPTVPITSFYVVGALYVAMGEVWGAAAPPVIEINAGQWKLAATGAGRGPMQRVPKGASKTERSRIKDANRKAEMARIVAWAQSVGYVGEQEDEAAACGIVVAAVRGVGKTRGRQS